MHLKLLQKINQNTAEETIDLTVNKIANKITKISRNLAPNNSGIVESGTEDIRFDREIPKERYISPEKGRKLLMI